MGRRGKKRAALAFAAVIGVVLVSAGIFKTLDPWSFLGSLPAYGVPAALRPWIVVLVPALEIGLGVTLVVGWQRRRAMMAASGLFVGFAALIAYGWGTGTLEECGCFGPFLKRSPGVALAQDLGLLAIAVMGSVWTPSDRGPLGRRQFLVLAAVALVPALVVSTTMVRGLDAEGLRFDGLAADPNISTGAEPSDPNPEPVVRTATLDQIDLRNGEVLLFLFHPRCPACQASAPTVGEYFRDGRLPRLVGLTFEAEPADVEGYLAGQRMSFPVYEIPTREFVMLTGDGTFPKLLFARDGRVLGRWAGTPPPTAELKRSLSEIR